MVEKEEEEEGEEEAYCYLEGIDAKGLILKKEVHLLFPFFCLRYHFCSAFFYEQRNLEIL